jgi:DNA transposition AAA+ family ATPase
MTVDELFNKMRDAVDSYIDDEGDDLNVHDLEDVRDWVNEAIDEACADVDEE